MGADMRKRAGDGFKRSRFNAVKHGLAAKHSLLPGEYPAAFEQLSAGYFARFMPQDAYAEGLVRELVDIDWKLHRYRRIEHATFLQALYKKLAAAEAAISDKNEGAATQNRVASEPVETAPLGHEPGSPGFHQVA